MMQVLMVVCLAASPGECREERLTLTMRALSPAQCMYSSVPRVSRWQTMHPKWKVASWRCAFSTEERSA